MLLCPQCEFENPDHNKFCQSCGTSLTHKTCQQCHAEIAWSVEICPHCGANEAQVWWGIIYQPEDYEASESVDLEFDQKIVSDQEQLPKSDDLIGAEQPWQRPITILHFSDPDVPGTQDQVEADPGLAGTVSEATEMAELIGFESQEENPQLKQQYLDQNQRYRLDAEAYSNLEQWLAGTWKHNSLAVAVIDTAPLQVTVLNQLLDNETLSIPKEETALSTLAVPEDLQIPELTFCYQALHKSFTTVIPKVHDAWQRDGQAVILLEDRSYWPLLAQEWSTYQVQQLPVLRWMDEMAQLWSPLAQLGCAQSLLEIDNLRLDEDETLCLQQLHTDSEECLPTLRDLGRLWGLLFKSSEQTMLGSLTQLLDELRRGKLKSVEEIRSRIRTIAQSQDQSSPVANNEVSSPGEKNGVCATEFLSLPTLNSQPSPELATQVEMDNSGELNEDISEMQTVVLPMQLSSLDYAACTDTGMQRNYNEDYFGVETKISNQEDNAQQTLQARGLFIVCDGMGGHAGGEDASAMAVLTLQKYFQTHWHHELPNRDILNQGILEANHAIYAINQQKARSGNQRMGTTLVMALVQNQQVGLAHVGDSRVYSYTRKRGLVLLSIDHEVGQREIKLGVSPQEAYARPDAYQLTQALGPRSNDFVDPDLTYLDIKEDTLLLLCSDGLSDHELLENHAQDYLAPLLSSRSNLEEGVKNLMNFANQHNGHDNITAVVIRLKVRPKKEQ